MSTMKLRQGDKVVLTTGKDKGKEGKILMVDRKNNRVIVEGANMISKHTKPSAGNQQGGIIKKEGFVHVSNVMLMFKGKPTRIGYKVTKEMKNGKEVTVKTRVAKSNGEAID